MGFHAIPSLTKRDVAHALPPHSALIENRCPQHPGEVADELVLGRLPVASRIMFEQHILTCSSCADAVATAEEWTLAVRAAAGEAGNAIPRRRLACRRATGSGTQ